MDIWDQILETRIVKTFRIISRQWWGLDVHFYDESGNRRDDVPLQNHFCVLMQKKKKTAKNCLLFHGEYVNVMNKRCKTVTCTNCENVKSVVTPIFAKGDYVGAIVCSGIQFPVNKSLREQSLRKFIRLGFDKKEIVQCYDKTRAVDIQTHENVLKFMQLVSEDLSAFFSTLLNEMKIKNEQALLVDWKLNGKYNSIVGKSTAMQDVFCKLGLIENSVSPVLIEGETGTGKELIASAIHFNSVLKDKPYIIQNCSAFSDEILNSELFGHEKGAFTSAVAEKKGLFEIADGGTLFLDEIGDVSMKLQGKLLRVLENGTFYRLGGVEEKRVNVRLITATNKDIMKQVKKGTFRKDLLYRINSFRLTVAPLRERRDDIVPLFHYFLEHCIKTENIKKKDISSDLIKFLVEYNWPGNVRELRNVVGSLIVMSGDSKSLDPEHLPEEMSKLPFRKPSIRENGRDNSLKSMLNYVDKEMTEKMLQMAKWNKTVAASQLGISRASLNSRIEKFSIKKKTL